MRIILVALIVTTWAGALRAEECKPAPADYNDVPKATPPEMRALPPSNSDFRGAVIVTADRSCEVHFVMPYNHPQCLFAGFIASAKGTHPLVAGAVAAQFSREAITFLPSQSEPERVEYFCIEGSTSPRP